GARGHVTKRPWPPSAGVADAAVLDVPRCDAGLGERGSHGPHVVDCDRAGIHLAKFRDPATAVNHDCQGVWTLPRRETEFPELQWIRSVRDANRPGRDRRVREVGRATRLPGDDRGCSRGGYSDDDKERDKSRLHERPPALAKFFSQYEFEARPDVIHRTDLDIHEPDWQRHVANGVFGDVRPHA